MQSLFYCTAADGIRLGSYGGQRALRQQPDFGFGQPKCTDHLRHRCDKGLCLLRQRSLYNQRTNIKRVIIGNAVISIGDYAFYGCTSLTSITIPNSVTTIGTGAFWGCSNLACAIIPDSVTTIGNYGFYNCTSLTSVTIPDSVISIGTGSFSSCTSLNAVVFTGSAPTISSSAFVGTTATAAFPAGDPSWTVAKRQNYGGTLTWVAAAAPAVLIQPKSVSAQGVGLTYQWQYSKNGSAWADIPGNSTSASITLGAYAHRDGWNIRCIISSDGTTAYTKPAAMTVVASVIDVTAQPEDQEILKGDYAKFTVAAEGQYALKYQWQYSTNGSDWANIPGNSTAASLVLTRTDARNGWLVRCVITDDYGTIATSDIVAMIVV